MNAVVRGSGQFRAVPGPTSPLRPQGRKASLAGAAGSCLRASLFLAIAGLAGCASHSPEPIRLVIISPHRDEIREEVGRAFPEWFRNRLHDRASQARTALETVLAKPDSDRQQQAIHAFHELLADWRPQDLGALATAYHAWQQQPTAEHGRALLAALDRWLGSLRPIEVAWLDVGGGTSQIARYINARYDSLTTDEGIGIDVLFGGGTEIYVGLTRRGRLERVNLPPALLARIPAQLNGVALYDPGGHWYGAMLSSFGILYNRWVLERIGQPEPRSWEDLGQPGLRSWISAGDPRLSGSVHMVYEIILQAEGWDKGFELLLRLGANTHSFIGDSGTLTRMVTNGEVAAAGNVDANAFIAVARDPDFIGYHLPAGKTIINPDAIGVLRGAAQPALARAFVEFTLSDAGQLLFLLQPGLPDGPRRHPLCRLSIVKDLYDAAAYEHYPVRERSVGDANPFAVRGVLPYNSAQGDRRWNALNDLLGAVIVDAHPDLAAAWCAVQRLPAARRQPLEHELFQPFVTEDELLAHARRIVEEGPRARAIAVNRWGEQARARYLDIRRQARD